MNRVCAKVLTLFFISCLFLLPGFSNADDKELRQRFSFAISGGASLGAYEAGLNWALLTIMHNLDKEQSVLLGQYRPVEISSLAGASAGGINTLLSGMLYCTKDEQAGGLANRSDDNIFRHVWLLPDINSLLPPEADSPIYRDDDALLARKPLIEAAEYLQQKWHQPLFKKGCRVPLGFTVTREEPEVLQVGGVEVMNQRFTIPFMMQVQNDGRIRFSLDPHEYASPPDFSMILLPFSQDQKGPYIAEDKIQKAALTSSAFPVAFGRKRLEYCRLKASYSEESETVTAAPADAQQGVSCPTGYELARAEFADGGLFDNLPLGLARKLAEESAIGRYNPLPVTYIYIDPDRRRTTKQKKLADKKCADEDTSAACQEMEYGLQSESQLLLGALGTARKYELYRELTSETWSLNMSLLAYELADLLESSQPEYQCTQTLPFFDKGLPCHEALRYAGRLLEIGYDRSQAPITPPFSIIKLQQYGIVASCEHSDTAQLAVSAECVIQYASYREDLADRLLVILTKGPVNNPGLAKRIRKSELSIRNDRVIRVTSRYAPITASLLNNFGAFLELKFREYDYYVGIYDAVVVTSEAVCDKHFSKRRQPEQFGQCREAVSRNLYTKLKLEVDPAGRYIFALLARQEFSQDQALRFAYQPMPPEVRDMRIIHEGLEHVAPLIEQPGKELISARVETGFFEYLKDQGFKPTPTEDDKRPLIAEIMDDPDQWPYELTRRFTNRLTYLERHSETVKSRRAIESEASYSMSALIGASSLALRTATYKYPDFDFAPSTAPKDWTWRYLIPYELATDLNQGDLMITWQPTWAVSRYNTLGLRGTFGIAEGLFNSASDTGRSNYAAVGLDYTRHTDYGIFSSYGITPAYYHAFREPETGDQNTVGGDIHVGLFKNKLRVGVGARDFKEFSDTWQLTIGLTDLPGFTYWLSR